MGLMSIESQEAVKCHKDYVAAKLIEDPNYLWKIIVDTHLTNPIGGIVRSKIKEEMDLKKKYERFSQRDTDIGTHFRAFNNWWLTLSAAGIERPSEDRLTISPHVVGHEEIWHDDDGPRERCAGIPFHP